MIEIRIHGRGGQGAVIASQILADALFAEGSYVQSFPQFGVERRGAPVTAFLRVGGPGESHFVRTAITTPDHIIVLDPTLLEAVNVLEGLKPGGWVIVNSPQPFDQVAVPSQFQKAVINATAIAVKYKLGSKTQAVVNTGIVGAFAKVTGLVGMDALLEAVAANVPVRPDENRKAAVEAFEQVQCAPEHALTAKER